MSTFDLQGFQIGVVGANEWKGGFSEYGTRRNSMFEVLDIESDSYMGRKIKVTMKLYTCFIVL